MKIFQLGIVIFSVFCVDLKLSGINNDSYEKCSKNSILQLLFRLPQTQCLFETILNKTLVDQTHPLPNNLTGKLYNSINY